MTAKVERQPAGPAVRMVGVGVVDDVAAGYSQSVPVLAVVVPVAVVVCMDVHSPTNVLPLASTAIAPAVKTAFAGRGVGSGSSTTAPLNAFDCARAAEPTKKKSATAVEAARLERRTRRERKHSLRVE